MIIIAGYLNLNAADRQHFIESHKNLVERARAFKGCVDLSISADPSDPMRVNNLEIWEDAASLDAWRQHANVPDHGAHIEGGLMKRYDAMDGGPLF